MISNIGGSRYTCRLLIVRVISSTLLYVVAVSGTALHVLLNAQKLSANYRRIALRVCFDSRSISDFAVFVISGMLSIEILTNEMADIHNLFNVKSIQKKGDLTKAS